MDILTAQVLENGEIKIEKTDDLEYDLKEDIANAICRGCLGVQNLKSMTQTYYHDGKAENYSDMLLFCFCVKLDDLLGRNNTKHTFICEECVKRLRDAADFRNQLETAKDSFDCLDQKLFRNNDIKSSDEEFNYDSSNDNAENLFEEKDSDPDFILDVKKISQFSVKRIRKKTVKNSLQRIADKQKKRLSKASKRDYKSEKGPWTKETMKSAAEDVFSEKLSPEDAEIKYGISQAAIEEKVALMKAGRRVDFSPKRGRFKNTFTEEYEDKLVEEVTASLKQSRPLPRNEFLRIARHLAKSLKIDHKFQIETESAGRNFYYYFMKRYPALNQKSQKRLLLGNVMKKPSKSEASIEGALNFLDVENVIKKRRKKRIKLLDIINDTDVKCKICNEEFLWNKNLKMHMSVHYPNHVCETCGHLSATRGQLYQHSYTHSKTQWACKLCPDKKYKTLTALQAHTKVKHLGETHAYKCPVCDERFKSFPRRRKHLVEMHNYQDKKYACKLCEKEFEAAGTLSTHVRIVHLKERNHKCAQCDHSFFSKKFLEDHMLSHSSERNFPCRYCEKRFKRKFTLNEHEKIHTGEKRHVCNLCGKAFTQKASLKGHMAVHDHEGKSAARN